MGRLLVGCLCTLRRSSEHKRAGRPSQRPRRPRHISTVAVQKLCFTCYFTILFDHILTRMFYIDVCLQFNPLHGLPWHTYAFFASKFCILVSFFKANRIRVDSSAGQNLNSGQKFFPRDISMAWQNRPKILFSLSGHYLKTFLETFFQGIISGHFLI